MINMINNNTSFPHLPLTLNSTPSTPPFTMEANPLERSSSYPSFGQSGEILMKLTRCRPITWTPFTPDQQRGDDCIGHSTRDECLLEDDGTGQALAEDIFEPLTSSARIALTYRMMHSRDGEDTPPSMMQLIDAGVEDAFSDSDEELRSVGGYHDQGLHKMLCGISPRIIENTANEFPESWKDNKEHAILHEYRYTAHTIVLDSRCPDLAPHIVITPPDEYSEDPWAAHNNRVTPQIAPNLCVPPFYMSTCRLATYYEWMAMFYPPPAPQSEEPTYHNSFSFNLGSFVEYSRNTACDRATQSGQSAAALFATNRLLIRSAAIAASEEAVEICKRYTPAFVQLMDSGVNYQAEQRALSPQRVFNTASFQVKLSDEETIRQLRLAFVSTSFIAKEWRTIYSPIHLGEIDRRFQWRWSDPAEPVLEDLQHTRPANFIIIQSDFPCSAPHIVIHLSETSPWIAKELYDPNFLSVDYGKAPRTTHENIPDDDEFNGSGSHFPSNFDENDWTDDTSDTDSSSCPGSAELQRVGNDFFSRLDDTDDSGEDDITDHYYRSQDITSLYKNTASSVEKPTYVRPDHSSQQIFYIYDDEEEDGPPEFDEWYTSWDARHVQAEA